MNMPFTEHIAKDGFRLRGTEMERIDGFSDVVFGFALTLLVVSLEVPKSYAELHELFMGFGPFLACFAFLILLWWSHYRYFRRYGTHDNGTIWINAALLFFVLFYAYPLKFLMDIFIGELIGRPDADKGIQTMYQVRELMTYYGLGFAAIYFCFAGLYANAWRQRVRLQLNHLERTLTLSYIADDVGVAIIGLLSCAVAWLLPIRYTGAAGFTFFLIGLWKTIHGIISGRYIQRARKQQSTLHTEVQA